MSEVLVLLFIAFVVLIFANEVAWEINQRRLWRQPTEAERIDAATRESRRMRHAMYGPLPGEEVTP